MRMNEQKMTSDKNRSETRTTMIKIDEKIDDKIDEKNDELW